MKTSAHARAKRATNDPGSAPTRDVLHEAALAYLGRSSATAATLTRVLDRKITTWSRKAAKGKLDPERIESEVATSRTHIEGIIARFREVGLINDAAYAKSRAKSLSRSGRSRRAIAAHLAAKGVASETAREAIPDDPNVELAAAVAFARKRRLGPYARESDEPKSQDEKRALRQKQIAAMARAGFGWSTCERVLRMDREEADERITSTRAWD